MTEQETIRMLFDKLVSAPLQSFPVSRGKLDAPNKPGVYVIYSSRGKILHVGRTPRAVLGKRLKNHPHGGSSFANKYLKGDYSRVRAYKFRCLFEANRRKRGLLEAYATGRLCPAHVVWVILRIPTTGHNRNQINDRGSCLAA
jgi:hypothetical protein